MPTVLIAPDKFKGSLTAAQVAEAVGDGLRRARPDVHVESVPVADGGDGTVAAALAAGFEHVPLVASGPTGEPVRTGYARRDDLAVVEMADVAGLVRLPGNKPAPLTASSRGVGEVVAAAVAAGCRRIVLGVGGSASTDGGAGFLAGLGARLLDASGSPVADGGAALTSISTIDLGPARDLMEGVELVLASDVDNPLIGPKGAAAIYGPQKGAGPEEVRQLEAALTHFAEVVAATTGADHRDDAGAGAAGGTGFAALVLGAEFRPGVELVLELVGFDARVSKADLVVTGEGALDEQTLHGKAPAGVAAAAGAAGVPVVAVCGRNQLTVEALRQAGITDVYALTDIEPDVARCLAEPAPLLTRIGELIAADHLSGEAGPTHIEDGG
ncbi:glycerate kinase [Mycolicibacterium agri]|uniref:Glycerate kinase n=1 Tax=Mycolicibacterium agri TaxID=36811 RepID=A0A2A7NB15_MYCAG|nr:glycerate kinase [Mycolicibacterium agri]PEG40648.1 glycerate kinase [Mycolicibacterium agri]GFG50396.1 glycerate kinase [Mycolicibacterium agri]